MWAARVLEGLNLPSSPPATIGTAVHKSTGVFDQAKLDGEIVTADDAAEVCLAHIKDPGEDVDWTGVSIKKAAEVALGVHTRYCKDIAPIHDYLAIEQTMDELELVWDDLGIKLILTGTLDRLFAKGEEIGVADLKTGARACSQTSGKHKAQVGAYELLAEKKTGMMVTMPGELIQLQTSSNYRAAVHPVVNARVALLGDDNHAGILTHMAKSLKSGDFLGNPSSWLCSPKYCPAWERCIYK